MKINLKKSIKWCFEQKTLAFLIIAFVCVISGAWIYAMKLRQTMAANYAVTNVDVRALVEVEHLRNIAEAQIANSRSYFLLGSKILFDQQKKDKQNLIESLTNFEKQYNLPQAADFIKRIYFLQQQQDDFFDQAMKFREKQTESKIVGQFYQSKTLPIRLQMNEALNEIKRLHNEELDRARQQAKQATLEAEVQIPRGMLWFTCLVGILFLSLSLLVIRMLRSRERQMAERDRLFDEAQKSVQARDEVISAISQDFNEPLSVVKKVAESLKNSTVANSIDDRVELIKSSVVAVETLIKDICDQKREAMGGLTLRLNQLAIGEVLDEAYLILQPLAKQYDVRLQFDSVNPPVLAFFDRERVIRVLWNLVGNAIKFSSKHSKIVVKVRSDQKFVYISVTDNGPGIPEKQLSEIFNNFWQAQKSVNQGTGIGLAVTKTIVEAHGGTVVVDSHVGHGSTFTFSLPRRRPVGANLSRPALPLVKSTSRAQSFNSVVDLQ